MSGARPLVSVVVPVYNAEAYLAAALDSILAQTYRPIEVVVADDGSTDRSAEIARAYGDRIRYVPGPPSGGYPGAPRNRGIAAASGELITFFDADDLMERTKIESQVDALRAHPGAGAVVTDYRNFTATGDAPRSHFETCPQLSRLVRTGGDRTSICIPGDLARYVLATENFANQFFLLPKAVLREVGGFDETLQIGEDIELLWRVATRYPIVVVNAVGFRRRLHDGNQTREPVRALAGKIRSREKILQVESRRAIRRRLRRSLAECHLALAECGAGINGGSALQHALLGFRLYPMAVANLRVLLRLCVQLSGCRVARADGRT